ncbi:MAG: hypothetical protein PHQ58_19595 [Rhodoferax sp.]|uniref:DUF6794 domain-containing protein n=1 Tax=Rhodoferax sp. TaxID=50421 RepID=UPI002609C883|nr:DUF6794 domain-containing protein [Rhodoferax sp.]MDD2882631.1 hypothetical protein [Rhodoferax sp.]
MTDHQDAFPTSVEAAVRLLQGAVPESEQSKLVAMLEGDLMTLHFGLGQWVQNHLGLWGVNPALLAATGESNADDASIVIICAFWQRLQEETARRDCKMIDQKSTD